VISGWNGWALIWDIPRVCSTYLMFFEECPDQEYCGDAKEENSEEWKEASGYVTHERVSRGKVDEVDRGAKYPERVAEQHEIDEENVPKPSHRAIGRRDL
jgi:hypothetical protein